MSDLPPKPTYRSSRFYAIALAGWVSLTVLALYVVLDLSIKDTERNFRQQAAQAAMEVRQKLQTNEAVLSGFSAFLAAVDGSDRAATERYAQAVTTPYPHLYMLEVAREVKAADRQPFEAEMRRVWDPKFALRDFAYQGVRRWQDVQPKPSYWPLIFLYPESHAVSPLYGLDLDSVPVLQQALRDAWSSKSQAVTRAFRLYEGDLAFILFQAIPRPSASQPADPLKPFAGSIAAMLVVKAAMLKPGHLDPRDQIRAEFVPAAAAAAEEVNEINEVIEVSAINAINAISDIPPLFSQDAAAVHPADTLLPKLAQQMDIAVGPQTVRMSFSRQVRWTDLSGFSLRAVALISLLSLTLVMLYLRRHYIAMQLAETEHARAEFLAMHDSLTDLPNRHLLADRIRQALLRWRRTGTMFALFVIDLDRFKEINDTYGHEGGDQVLRTVAHRIANSLRGTDTVARYGGDEFIVLIADVLGESEARGVGEKLLSVIGEAILFGDQRLRVTCSLGIALCPRDGIDFEALFHQADHAMYKVKDEGRNGVFSQSLLAVDNASSDAPAARSG